MADQVRSYGHQTAAILPAEQGIAEWYESADIDTYYWWSEPLRRKRNVLGQLWFLLLAVLASLRIAALVRSEDVDVVHVNEVRYPYALFGARLGGARVVCHVRANYESRTLRRVLSTATAILSHRVLCVSERTKEIMFDDVGIDSDHVQVLWDGLPVDDDHKPIPQESSFREEYGIDQETTLVLCLSKLVEIKGQERVVDAAQAVNPPAGDVTFALVGGSVAGHEEYERTLRRDTRDMENVVMTGFYEDAMAAIVACDVLVHVPTYEDPFPNVVLEGMMCGKPVIGASIGGIPEQVIDGETGILVPATGEGDDIATAVEHLHEDPSKRNRIGARAKDHVEETLDPERYYEELDALYRRV
ncbi:glycosyltransferase family 4 protein [Halorubellus litoreus]|uniref:Glycosyltransferase family 4 protein n=1 Tax=Halorubellus litoreus TaxID=755308 RepID=A0ABD5VBY6_9EURY